MLLVVSQSRKKAVTIADIFRYLLILSYPCTPKEALTEMSTKYHAVIVLDPIELPDAHEFIKNMRSLADVPIFAVTDFPKECPCPHMFDQIYKKTIFSSSFITGIEKYCKEQERKCVGEYRLEGIDLSYYKETPTFFFEPVPLTKTERMILSYLIITHPLKQSNAKIIKYSYKARKHPELTSIRVHISNINKKFERINEKPIIANIPGQGYHLLTHDITSKINEIL